jgi:hypothetical protein
MPHIFGPDHGSLKGKTMQKTSDQVWAGGLVPIPAMIMAGYQSVVCYVSTFLVTISVTWLKNAKADTILADLTEVRNVYVKRGFLLEIIDAGICTHRGNPHLLVTNNLPSNYPAKAQQRPSKPSKKPGLVRLVMPAQHCRPVLRTCKYIIHMCVQPLR